MCLDQTADGNDGMLVFLCRNLTLSFTTSCQHSDRCSETFGSASHGGHDWWWFRVKRMTLFTQINITLSWGCSLCVTHRKKYILIAKKNASVTIVYEFIRKSAHGWCICPTLIKPVTSYTWWKKLIDWWHAVLQAGVVGSDYTPVIHQNLTVKWEKSWPHKYVRVVYVIQSVGSGWSNWDHGVIFSWLLTRFKLLLRKPRHCRVQQKRKTHRF